MCEYTGHKEHAPNAKHAAAWQWLYIFQLFSPLTDFVRQTGRYFILREWHDYTSRDEEHAASERAECHFASDGEAYTLKRNKSYGIMSSTTRIIDKHAAKM